MSRPLQSVLAAMRDTPGGEASLHLLLAETRSRIDEALREMSLPQAYYHRISAVFAELHGNAAAISQAIATEPPPPVADPSYKPDSRYTAADRHERNTVQEKAAAVSGFDRAVDMGNGVNRTSGDPGDLVPPPEKPPGGYVTRDQVQVERPGLTSGQPFSFDTPPTPEAGTDFNPGQANASSDLAPATPRRKPAKPA